LETFLYRLDDLFVIQGCSSSGCTNCLFKRTFALFQPDPDVISEAIQVIWLARFNFRCNGVRYFLKCFRGEILDGGGGFVDMRFLFVPEKYRENWGGKLRFALPWQAILEH